MLDLLEEDIESDLHRYHGIWIDIDEDDGGEVPAQRLFSLIERLSAYDGAVAARLYQLEQQEKNRNPSRDRIDQAGTTVTDQIGPSLDGVVEYETV